MGFIFKEKIEFCALQNFSDDEASNRNRVRGSLRVNKIELTDRALERAIVYMRYTALGKRKTTR